MRAHVSRNAILYGSDRPPAGAVALRAGPLQMSFDPETAFVRRIACGESEVLRGVYMAVRDRTWGTVTPTLHDLAVEAGKDAFSISFTARCTGGEVDFAWQGKIVGTPDGSLLWSMKGRALSEFLSNRIGFCILHPILACAGKPCTVERVDGAKMQGNFPGRISPHQPFLEMRGISHEVSEGLRAEVRFEGGVFEMEDQRNWTDASFKIYCPPLALPIPVNVARGAEYEQSVSLRLEGHSPHIGTKHAVAGAGRVIRIAVGERSGSLPRIGLQIAPAGKHLSDKANALLSSLGLRHLRVDLRLSDKGWPETLLHAAGQSRALGAPLEAGVILSDRAGEELRGLARELGKARPRVSSWLVFHEREDCTSAQWVRLARQALSTYDAGTAFGAGSNRYFAEINRGYPPQQDIDVVCFPANPQVHLFDSESMVETLAMLAQCLANAKALAGGLPVAVSPLTLHGRGQEADARQTSLFAAAWTVGAAKYLAAGGARSVTFYETLGSRGLMAEGSETGSVFPVYHALADMAPFAEGATLATTSSSPLEAEALVLAAGGKVRILAANLTDVERRVSIHVEPARSARVLMLDETSAAEAMERPEVFRSRDGDLLEARGDAFQLTLLPYAVARLDADAGPLP